MWLAATLGIGIPPSESWPYRAIRAYMFDNIHHRIPPLAAASMDLPKGILTGSSGGRELRRRLYSSACMKYANISRRLFQFVQQPGSASPADTWRSIDDVLRRSVSYRSYRSCWSVLRASSVLSVASAAYILR